MAPFSNPSPRVLIASWLEPARWLSILHLSGCDHVGAGARAFGRPIVQNGGSIEIGRDVTLRSLGSPVRLVATSSGRIEVGDHVLVDVGAFVFSESSVRIESGSVIGPHATVCDRDETGRVGPIVIESDVRVGAGARILGPCRVPRGSVVPPGATFRAPAQPHANGVLADAKASPVPLVQAKAAAPGPTRRVSAVLAADFTVNELAEHLAASDFDGLAVDAEVAPFDQVVPTLMALAARDPKVDLAVVWTRPEHVSPAFRDALLGAPVDPARVLSDVDAFAAVIKAQSGAARFLFVPTWAASPWRRGLGILELRGDQCTSILTRMNLRLAESLAEVPNTFVLDAQRWLSAARDGGVDPKLWHAGKIAFTTDVLRDAAADIRAALRGVLGMSRKLVVVDLDDTLWGGIVGDVGWESLRLGGHDAVGEAHVQFQKQLVALTKRGIALAVVSKNEESTALEAMRSHPEMVIRPEALAAYRINWRDKATNIVEIAQELNLGLQSVVFLDDNPIERGRVREELPEVYVPDWPLDPTHYPRALDLLRCFDTPHISTEDLERNAMYATERERTSLRRQVSSMDEWLATLGLVVRFEPLGSGNGARAAQLLNKTNQLNLRTRRLSEAEFLAWPSEPGRETWAVHVSDRFGAAGLTGLLSLERVGDDVHLVDYVLSCRVMGRRVEDTMLWAAVRRAGVLGGLRLVAAPIPTKKNKPCLDFFAGAGLEHREEGYVRRVDPSESAPSGVAIEGLS